MQVQINDTHLARDLARGLRHLPCQIDGQGRGPDATRDALHRQDHPAPRRHIADMCGLMRCHAHLFQSLCQHALGHRVGREFIRAGTHQPVQGCRRQFLNHQQHRKPARLRRRHDADIRVQFALISALHGQDDAFRRIGVQTRDLCERIVQARALPTLTIFTVQILDQQIELIQLPRDGEGFWCRRLFSE